MLTHRRTLVAAFLLLFGAGACGETPTGTAPRAVIPGIALGSSADVTGTLVRITADPAEQRYPTIDGELITWQDGRNGNWDIYLHDISEGTESPVTTDPVDQGAPDISGDRIVEDDYRHGNSDVFLYDLSAGTETQITAESATQGVSSISGDRIVWTDKRSGDWDIYLYEISTGTETRITAETATQIGPAISGDRIVWMDDRNGDYDVYLYDLSTGTETRITTDPADQRNLAVSGDRIVWNDRRNGNWDVYLYDLVTETETQITSDPAEQRFSAISGDRIVWEDQRNGNSDIYMYDIVSETETQITSHMAAQWRPDISGDRIVWTDNRNGKPDIYLYDLSEPGATPAGEEVQTEPVDPSTGTAPVTVTFDEVTDGGSTSLETSGTGPPPPDGFKLGSPPVYYDVSTTATYDGVITVCLDYGEHAEDWFGGNQNKERSLKLFHEETDPATGQERWVDVTTTHDLEADVICGEVSSLSLFAAAQDGEGPVASSVTADPNPVAVNTTVTVSALVDDAGTGGSDVASAEYSVDGGATWSSLGSRDGAFDETAEEVSGTSALPAPEVLDVCVRGSDAPENIGSPECILLAVYDPSAGFATGGGWIHSPAGAYAPDPALAGKASFGFVSKYRKGTTEPTGKTEFQFRAGDMTFRSTSYEWLVVTGNDYARFKGSGTINGTGDYRFMLWAGDGSPDTFRIRIWEEDEATGVETVVYDNGSDQILGGGSIVVHAK